MISRKAVKRKTAPAKAGTAVLEVEDRRRMARLVGKVEGDARRAEKRRYQEACIREGHLTNCLSKARTANRARKILWLFSTNMPVSVILAYLELPHVTCPARTCFSPDCPKDNCPEDFDYDPKRLSIIFKTGHNFINMLALNPSRAKVMLTAALEISQQVLLEIAIRRRK